MKKKRVKHPRWLAFFQCIRDRALVFPPNFNDNPAISAVLDSAPSRLDIC